MRAVLRPASAAQPQVVSPLSAVASLSAVPQHPLVMAAMATTATDSAIAHMLGRVMLGASVEEEMLTPQGLTS